MPQDYQAKRCMTAAGVLIHQDKVLLVKHKKLGMWLNPGGHVDPEELPHQAAEREFWEETGVKVRAKRYGFMPDTDIDHDIYFPAPFAVNLHWVSRENYEYRVNGHPLSQEKKDKWSRGCEQHLNYMYMLEPTGTVEFSQNLEECDGIAWFSPEELDDLEMMESIRQETRYAFEISR